MKAKGRPIPLTQGREERRTNPPEWRSNFGPSDNSFRSRRRRRRRKSRREEFENMQFIMHGSFACQMGGEKMSVGASACRCCHNNSGRICGLSLFPGFPTRNYASRFKRNKFLVYELAPKIRRGKAAYPDTLAVNAVHDSEGNAEIGVPRLFQLVSLVPESAL